MRDIKQQSAVGPGYRLLKFATTPFRHFPTLSFAACVSTCLQGLLVLFMTATAFTLYDSDNLVPLAPFGAKGVLKGSVAAFFGFLGFDEVKITPFIWKPETVTLSYLNHNSSTRSSVLGV